MEQKLAIKYLNGIVVESTKEESDVGQSGAFIANLMSLGYLPTQNLADELARCDEETVTGIANTVIPILKEALGAHVKHNPFYPNFPQQVMDMSDFELLMNAICHYWTEGEWIPNFEINDRPVQPETIKWKTLGVVTSNEVDGIFTKLLASADSISAEGKAAIAWFIQNNRDTKVPSSIPFKENACIVAAEYLKQNKPFGSILKTPTDVLRMATYLSDGDVSLAEPTKFKTLPRATRRALVKALGNRYQEEDFLRHKEKWVRLFHNLHVGDYDAKLYQVAKKLREHVKIPTFNGRVANAIQNRNLIGVIDLLKTRPGEYARKLSYLMTTFTHGRTKIINGFSRTINEVPMRNLLQLWGSMKTRVDDVEKRVVFPKGQVSKAMVVHNTLPKLPKHRVNEVNTLIEECLVTRLNALDPLGKVWIDPRLSGCPLPTGMRSASANIREVARGTRLPIGDKNTLRFFIYWVGNDIDLSASFHDEDFNMIERISFYNLRNGGLKACHSGDITRAPQGASEFIDVDIDSALKYDSKIRYVAMMVYVYSGPSFAEHDTCFAGWMTRDYPNSNEIYDPKTVEYKIDLRSKSKNAMPVMFDLKTREAIWMDMTTNADRFDTNNYGTSGNCVDANRATIKEMIEAFTSLDNKVTLDELLRLHASVRGELVDKREDADFVASFDDDADLTPYDIIRINSEFII